MTDQPASPPGWTVGDVLVWLIVIGVATLGAQHVIEEYPTTVGMITNLLKGQAFKWLF